MSLKIDRRTFVGGVAAASAALCAPSIVRAQEGTIRIGHVKGNSIYWDLLVASEKGMFVDNGLQPETTALQSSPQGVQLLVSRSIDFVAVQPEPLVSAIEQGGTGIGGLCAPMNRADWTLNVQPEIKSLEDLRGKVIGVSALQNSECWQTIDALGQAGVGPDEFDFLVVGTSPSKIIALQQKSIAATVLFQPSGELAVNEGFPALIRYAGLREYPSIIYAADREWAATGAGVKASAALKAAHDWLFDQSNRDEAIQLLATATNREPEVVSRIYDMYFVNDPIYSPSAAISIAGLTTALEDMVEKGGFMQGTEITPDKYLIPEDNGGLTE